jgi:hypothetical protein
MRISNFSSTSLTNLGGVFASDPSVSESPDGAVYITAKNTPMFLEQRLRADVVRVEIWRRSDSGDSCYCGSGK